MERRRARAVVFAEVSDYGVKRPAPGSNAIAERCACREAARRISQLARRIRTATHEVNDLKLVAVCELGLRPAVARNQFAVKFDGNAIGFEAELRDEIGKA